MLNAGAWVGGAFVRGPKRRRALFNALRLGRPQTERLRQQDALRFLGYVFARRHKSYAQILQDLWVCFELDEKRAGFFVEFGATNGVLNSNTWLLESEYGWSGILSEPNPFWHSDLAANRKAVIDHRCVSSSSGDRVSFLTTDHADPELSGIAEFADGDHFGQVRADGKEIKVETVSLNDLLTEYRAPREIDYMSIDTEGSEFDILSAFDFSRHTVRLLSVEQNGKTEGPIESLLASRGFVRVFREYSQWDGWYRHESAQPRPGAAGLLASVRR